MDVRLVRPTDALLVLGLSLDEGAHLVRNAGWPSSNPLLRSMTRAVLAHGPQGRAWVIVDDEGQGLLEASPRRYVLGWDITRLAIRGDHDALLPPLLSAALEHVQRRQVPRLFARCAEECAPELQHSGFNALAREYVLLGEGANAPDEHALPVDSRYRMPQDAWPLHQLESEVTPTLVRQMEGLTSMDWSRQRSRIQEIVVERDGRVVAWVGWGPRLHRGARELGMLIHPDHSDLGPSLLEYARAQVRQGTPLVARVRDYHPQTLNAFLGAGFTIVADETLMVKHAQVVPAPAVKPLIGVAVVPRMRAFHHHLRVIVGNPHPPLAVRGGCTEEES